MRTEKRTMAASLALVGTLALGSIGVQANDPVMPEITVIDPADGATLIASTGFPFVTTLKFQIKHPTLETLNVLDVKVSDTSILGVAIGNPFEESGGTRTCRAVAFPSPRTCTVFADNQTAEVTVPWSIPSVGTYTIAFTVRDGGQAIELEDVTVNVVISAEYPAPPSIANAYIKAAYGKLNSKAHGCVISKVAERHAKESGFETGYGPKGGPYDTDKVHADVDVWKGVCGG
jgi:hypothetical protein